MSPAAFDDLLNRSRLVPYFQPKVALHDGALCGVEVSTYLFDPLEDRMIPPGAFIEQAEQLERIGALTNRLHQTLIPMIWPLRKRMGEPQCLFAVNIAPQLLGDDSWLAILERLLQQHGLTPADLIIEVTERELIHTQAQFETLNRLRIHGFGLALDDFGTGFTNLAQLREFPYTEVKIDRSLAHDVAETPLAQTICRALLALGRERGMKVLAEGVEHLADLRWFEAHGCDALQGFLVSRPKSAEQLADWALSWATNNPLRQQQRPLRAVPKSIR